MVDRVSRVMVWLSLYWAGTLPGNFIVWTFENFDDNFHEWIPICSLPRNRTIFPRVILVAELFPSLSTFENMGRKQYFLNYVFCLLSDLFKGGFLDPIYTRLGWKSKFSVCSHKTGTKITNLSIPCLPFSFLQCFCEHALFRSKKAPSRPVWYVSVFTFIPLRLHPDLRIVGSAQRAGWLQAGLSNFSSRPHVNIYYK